MLSRTKFERISQIIVKPYFGIVYIVFVIFILGFSAVVTFLSKNLILDLQKQYYMKDGLIFHGTGIFIALPVFFFSMYFLGIVSEQVIKIFPSLHEAFTKISIDKALVNNNFSDDYTCYREYKKRSNIRAFSIIIISVVVFIFSFDSYTKIDETGLIVNSFFSLKEERMEWNGIYRCKIYPEQYKDKHGDVSISFPIYLDFGNDNYILLHANDFKSLNDLQLMLNLIYLKSKKEIFVVPLNASDIKLLSACIPSYSKMIHNLFLYMYNTKGFVIKTHDEIKK
jgi:hypothetical protein